MKTKKSGSGNIILIVVVSLVGIVFLSMLLRPRTAPAPPPGQPNPGDTRTWGIFSGIASIISALNPAAIIESFRKKPSGGGEQPLAVDCSLFPDDPECL